MTDGVLESAVRIADTSLKHMERLLKVLKAQYVVVAMRFWQRFGVRLRKEVSELKRLIFDSIRKLAGCCEEGCSRFALQ